MTGEAFRAMFQEAVSVFAAAQGVPAFYENGPCPNLDTVGDIWLDCEIEYHDAATMTMGERPRGRAMGLLKVRVMVREGAGTQRADQLLDALEELFRPQIMGTARLDFPARMKAVPALGWLKQGIVSPFSLDRP